MVAIQKTFKRGLFDRADGWRVRNLPAVFFVVPFIMRTRIDSQNYVEQDVDMDAINAFVREHRQAMPGLATLHIYMAALVRVLSQRPYLNRFVVWNKIFARNHISISLMIKRNLTDDGEETLIKPEFSPTDTLADVVKKVNALLHQNKPVESKNGTDKTANFFGYFPAFLVRFGVWCLRVLDNLGILPGAIRKVSPWHCSVFVTNLASLRVKPIYHHLYEFGTCTLFAAIGKPEKKAVVEKDDKIAVKHVIGAKYVMDERVCDGHYYAASMRMLYSYLEHPERLLDPPESVVIDDGVTKPRIDTAP